MTTAADARSCAGCTLCCKVLAISALDKPAGIWCPNCAVGEGCGIYETRPDECRSFHCSYRLDASLSEDWAPKRCRFMVTRDKNRLVIHADPARLDAWRKAPFYQTIRNWGAALTPKGVQVFVVENGAVTMILPHGEKKLGIVGDDKMIVVYRPNQPQAPAYDAIAVPKDDPLALRAAQQSDQA